MAKKIYVGVNGVARKVKSGCVGVAGVARKVKSGYVGVAGVARQCWSGELEAGHYWLIDSAGTKEYTADGSLVVSNTNTTSWECLYEGLYSIELHAKGGTGGDGKFASSLVNGARSAAGGGGGGGGSGVIFSNAALSAGTYAVAIDASSGSYTEIYNTVLTTQLRVGCGADGGDGTAAASSSSASADGGAGGAAGTVTKNLINGAAAAYTKIGVQGETGNYKVSLTTNTASASAVSGGTGGASIGSYGKGGSGANAKGTGGAGTAGAIIIRKL